MAHTDKNIVISPAVGNTTTDPKIVFSGADASTTAQNITVSIYPTGNGTLSVEGSVGQLFSVVNSMTGTIFSVNDISGIPSIEVLDTGIVKIAQYSGDVLLGTATDDGVNKLQVSGSVIGTVLKSNVATGTAPLVVTSTTTVANLAVATATTAGTVTTNAQPNITSVGTLTSLAVTGNTTSGNANVTGQLISTVATGTAPLVVTSTTQVANLSVATAGLATFATTANAVAGANVSGAVAFATTANAVAGANVSGAVAFATTANAVAGANVSGQVGNAAIAGTVYTNAQPNITSVGTLSALTVSGTTTLATGLTGLAKLSAGIVSAATADVDYVTVATAEQEAVDMNVCGFVNNAQTTISFDGINTFTLTDVGAGWDYYRAGKKYHITGSKSVVLTATPPAAAGTYYISLDSVDGTLTASTTGWALENSVLPVAIVYWDNALTPKYQLAEERHTMQMDVRDHRYLHLTQGTKFISGATLSGYTLSSDNNISKTFAVSSTVIADEDLFQTLAALTQPNGTATDYTVWYRNSPTTWVWKLSNMPFPYNIVGANDIIQYDLNGTMTDVSGGTGTNARWVNSYLIITNQQGSARYSIIPGQAIFTTLAAAQAESPTSFTFTGLSISESVIAYQLTWARNSTAYTSQGKCVLASAPKRINVAAIQNISSGTGVDHASLAGLQGGQISQYYHLTSAEYTGTGTGNFVRESAPVLASATVTANLAAGNLTTTGQLVSSVVTGTAPLVVSSTTQVANLNVATAGLATYATTANAVAGANVSGQVGNAAIAGTVYTNAQPNITSVGTLSALSVTGNVTAGNSSATTHTGTTVNVTGQLISTVATGTAPLVVSSTTTVANLNAATAGVATYALIANSVAGANVSGQVGNAAIAGTVYTNAQPNITSVGTLTGLTVSGVSNLNTVANVVITGGANGQYLKTDGSGNLSWANVISGGTPGGGNTQLQFNDANAFAGANIFYDKTSNVLSVSGDLVPISSSQNIGFTCGYDHHGQLGLGTNVGNQSTLQQVDTKGPAWVSFTHNSAWYHMGVVKSDGTLWMWGSNPSGELGIGDTSDWDYPKQVGNLTDWSKVAGGDHFTAAIKTDGTLWTWGTNYYGQLGLGDTANRSSPTQVGNLTNWRQSTGNQGFTAAVKTDGTLWAWGGNYYGQLGLGDTVNRSSPTQVGSLTDWSQVDTGNWCMVAIKTDGTLWTWGYNYIGQLGLGDTVHRSSPTQVGLLTNWAYVSASTDFMVAKKSDGTIWSWGNNYVGELGLGDTVSRSSPTQVGLLTNWAYVSVGSESAAAIKTDGTLWTWGVNGNGQLGQNDFVNRSSPTQVGALTTWVKVEAARRMLIATRPVTALNSINLKTLGTVTADTLYGTVKTPDQSYITTVGTLQKTSLAADLVAAGGVTGTWISGTDYFNPNRSSPTQVSANVVWDTYTGSYGLKSDHSLWLTAISKKISNIATWRFLTESANGSYFLINNDNTLWAWGVNSYGQLGLGDINNRLAPTQIGTLTDWSVVSITTGFSAYHTAAIKTDGTLWTWGANNVGQLGLGDIVNRSSPTQVGLLTNWSKVSANDGGVVAIKTDSTLWAWGYNYYGQLGLGDTVNRSSPIQVGSLTDWSQITTGVGFAAAIKTDGTLWTWGANNSGQLGLGDTVTRSSPTQVGLLTDWSQISVTGGFAAAIKTDGTLWTWGVNGNGQLGQNDIANRSSPTQVGALTTWTKVNTAANQLIAYGPTTIGGMIGSATMPFNTVYALKFSGEATSAKTVSTNAQPNITSVGTLTSLAVTGNISSGNLTTAGDISAGNITVTGNITGTLLGSATTAGWTNNANVANTVAGANVTGVVPTAHKVDNSGFTSGYLIYGQVGTANTMVPSMAANFSVDTTTGILTATKFSGNGSLLTNLPDGVSIINGTSNVSAALNGNITIGVAGNANIGTFTGTGANISGYLGVTGNISAGNVSATTFTGALSGAATTAGTVTTNAQPNITSVGTLTGLTVSGVSNLNAIGNLIITGGANGQVLTTNGSGNLSWATPTTGGAWPTVSVVSTTTANAIAGEHYVLTNVAATTINLPATPTSGDVVMVTPDNSLANNVVGRNGQTIMHLTQDLTLDNANTTVTLRFLNNTWRII